MKTDELIRLIAADAGVREPLGPALAAAVTIGVAVAVALVAGGLRLRPDLLAALAMPRVVFKLVLTAVLAAMAVTLLDRIGRPGVPVGPAVRRLALPALALVVAVAFELVVTDPATWGERLVGRTSGWCLLLVPSLAMPPLGLILWAMRRSAPESPARAGAVAGLAAAAIAAAAYAWHCQDDSPLFVATWYTLGGIVPVLVGALVGRRVIRW